MIYEQIKKQGIHAVPFVKLLGAEALSVSDGHAEVRLTQREDLSNHVGTLHAAAIFALGETASGLAMAGAMAPQILAIRPVAASANARYLKPARGTVTATGKIAASAEDCLRELKAQGKTVLPVEVSIADEAGVVVATMSVEWHIRLKSQ